MAELLGSMSATEQVPAAPSEPAGVHGTATPRGVLAVGLLAAAVPFLLYLRTMAPTVYGLDSAELSAGAYVLGIVHSPGAPTYLLLGHLFTFLPVGDVGGGVQRRRRQRQRRPHRLCGPRLRHGTSLRRTGAHTFE